MDILKAIYEDIDEYLKLCKKYNEKPQLDPHTNKIAPYGQHARKLKKRAAREKSLT